MPRALQLTVLYLSSIVKGIYMDTDFKFQLRNHLAELTDAYDNIFMAANSMKTDLSTYFTRNPISQEESDWIVPMMEFLTDQERIGEKMFKYTEPLYGDFTKPNKLKKLINKVNKLIK